MSLCCSDFRQFKPYNFPLHKDVVLETSHKFWNSKVTRTISATSDLNIWRVIPFTTISIGTKPPIRSINLEPTFNPISVWTNCKQEFTVKLVQTGPFSKCWLNITLEDIWNASNGIIPQGKAHWCEFPCVCRE